jgi:hypothetical protein
VALELSIVVVAYQMGREAPRTLQSLMPPLQRHADSIDYEVIVVDNGSPEPLVLPEIGNQVRMIRIEPKDAKTSPGLCINETVDRHVRGTNVMICIDGARLPSSHLVRRSADVLRREPRAFAFSASRHLGPKRQMASTKEGYNQQIEDGLLASVAWESNLDCLYEISVWAGAHDSKDFLLQNESNAVAMSLTLWKQLGGFHEGFQRPGGGLSNLELFSRAVSRPDAFNVLLFGESTFHQVHGGAATSSDGYYRESLAEYHAVIGSDYVRPTYKFWADLGEPYGRMNAVGRFLHG